MKYKKIIIYGGTSEISLNLIKYYFHESEKFLIFCRVKNRFIKFLGKQNLNIDLLNKVEIFETDLVDLEKNLEIIQNFENEISGVFWISGYNGDSYNEYQNITRAKNNLNINFINPVLILMFLFLIVQF
jgi:short-subunit dehydrogenase